MLCAIYRSSKRDQTYLYVQIKDDFSLVPEDLMNSFGKPQLAMVLSLDECKKLASAETKRVKLALKNVGYYLQCPPPVENLLNQHLSDVNA